MNLVALLLSVLLHAALVVAALPDDEKLPRKARPISIFGDPPIEFMPAPGAAEPMQDAALHRAGDISAPECDREYVGIGVTHNVWGHVIGIGVGYPAHRAGIRVGDVVEGEWPEPDADGIVTLVVTRGSEVFIAKMKVERICIREPVSGVPERPRGGT